MGAIVREIEIDGQMVKFMASARTPRLYRSKFNRDLIVDMMNLKQNFDEAIKAKHIPADATEEDKKKMEQSAELSVMDLNIFENMAYVMAKQACPDSVSDSIDEWMDQFGAFSVYEIFPKLSSMWTMNTKTIVEAKKK